MRLTLVHEWLTTWGGSEQVLEALAELYPQAPIHTLVHEPHNFTERAIGKHTVHTSFIQKLPWATRRYPFYLPLMPLAVEQFDLGGFDVVVSSNHAVAKGVLTRADQLHISYVHTPIRYAWDMQFRYLREAGLNRGVRAGLARAILHYLRLWDRLSADRVDVFIANSAYVARRIRKTYRREATVIYPPVGTERFNPRSQRDDFYLTLARLVPYKRIDLIVQAFTRLGMPLVVLGDGPERARIEALAGSSVQILGFQPDEVVKDYLERCKAFVFAADEDFGIVPVEAQAAGAAVIAYGQGGVLESVVEGQTGLFYPEQTIDSLIEAVHRFETDFTSDPERNCRNAERFNKARFQQAFEQLVTNEWGRFSKSARL